VYRAQVPVSTLQDYLHGKEMTQLRNNMCHGTTPAVGCRTCWTSESLGLDSTRKQLLKKSYVSDQLSIKMLDIFFGNTCNMACFMCGPEWSSKQAEESYRLGLIPKKVEAKDNTEIILDTIDRLPDLEQVSFIGGEFFIFKNNLRILDKMISRGIGARVVTNASVLTDSMLEKLSKLPNLELQISVDGIEDSYEIMRYPNKWQTLQDNFYRLKNNIKNGKINFHLVAQVLNCQDLMESFNWFNLQITPVSVANLVSPEYLSWKILTDNEKSDLKNLWIEKQKKIKLTSAQIKWIENLVSALDKVQCNLVLRKEFIETLAKRFQYRGVASDKIKKQLGIFTELSDAIIKQL
jgi:organic radical activating enzyme